MGSTMDPYRNQDRARHYTVPVEQYTSQTGVTLKGRPDQANNFYIAAAAQNDEATYRIPPSAPGTWIVAAIGQEGPDKGIVSLYVGALKVGELDFYAATEADNVLRTATVTIHDGTATTFKVKAEAKNASSSGYAMHLNHLAFGRQA